jgi:hypothetical protein
MRIHNVKQHTPLLFHARFAMSDRQRIEETVMWRRKIRWTALSTRATINCAQKMAASAPDRRPSQVSSRACQKILVGRNRHEL